MKKKFRILLISLATFIVASVLSVYSYGIFASRVKGETSYALPTHENETIIDRALTTHLQAHPEETGLILLTDNLDAFMARAITARSAGRSLDLQYYIWHDDLTGRLLDLEILQAADRGVRVRMILDDMTAHGRESTLAKLDLHPNIEIRLFNPTRARHSSLLRGAEMLLRLVTTNRRMHNKAWIADNRVAVVGGRNIGDEYFDAAQSTNFFDIDLLLAGNAVAETSRIFDDFWNSDSLIPLQALVTPKSDALEQLRTEIQKDQTDLSAIPYIQRLQQTSSIMAIYNGEKEIYWSSDVHVYSDPAEKGLGLGQNKWLIYTLLPVWKGATQEFKIISPYFVPGNFGVEEFSKLTATGTDVSILTNSLAATDVMTVHSGYAPYREPLLRAGVQLYELKPFSEQKQKLFGSSGASLHTKAFLIDNKLGFVGSFNFDPRSAILNTEMGVVFTEPRIVAELMAEFDERTSGKYSYSLNIDPQTNQLIWQSWVMQDGQKINQTWQVEPQSSWWKRTTVKVLSWLPIESQL